MTKNADFSHPIFDPIAEKIFNREFEINGIIKITHERQKQRPSYKVMEGTLKKHVRDLYDMKFWKNGGKKKKKTDMSIISPK